MAEIKESQQDPTCVFYIEQNRRAAVAHIMTVFDQGRQAHSTYIEMHTFSAKTHCLS